MLPSLKEEKKIRKRGYKVIVGLDEAGRGPLAGPVVAAAVTIENHSAVSSWPNCCKLKIENFRKLKDSKKLSPKKREEFYKIITRHPVIKWGRGIVSERVIDKINIKNAAELAMERALKQLEKKTKRKADFLIIDGNCLRNHKLKTKNYKLIVKADEKVFSCAAASIIAKVTRDRLMRKYEQKYPGYRFDVHKGYPTKLHLKMLKKHGSCAIHRKSFRPIRLS